MRVSISPNALRDEHLRRLEREVALTGADFEPRPLHANLDPAVLAVERRVRGLITEYVVGAGVGRDGVERPPDVVLVANHQAAGVDRETVHAVFERIEPRRASGRIVEGRRIAEARVRAPEPAHV